MQDARSEVAYQPDWKFKTSGIILSTPEYYAAQGYPIPEFEVTREGHFFSVGEERRTPQVFKRSPGWKRFEHYKAFRTPKTLSVATQFWHSNQNFPAVAFSSGPLIGSRALSQGYNGLGGGVLPFGEPGLPVSGLPAYVVEQTNGHFLPVPDDYPSLEARAMRQMLPGIKAELSLINSIIELKDFKSIAKTVAKSATLAVKRGATLRQQFRRAYRSVRNWSSNRPTEATAAGIYLQLQFNILPLISDVMAIRNAIARTEERVRKLVNRAGVPQTTHFTTRLPEETNSTTMSGENYYLVKPQTGEISSFALYQVCQLERIVRNDEPVFHAELDYNYTLSNWQVEHAQLLGLLDGLGVNLNPAIIWNAIPWSFVVDWLVNVSRWLNDRKTINMQPRINIRRYLWSYKRSRWSYLRADLGPSGPWPVGGRAYPQDITLPSVREISYKREVGLPGVSSITSSGVSLNEFTLGSALVIARRRVTKRRA